MHLPYYSRRYGGATNYSFVVLSYSDAPRALCTRLLLILSWFFRIPLSSEPDAHNRIASSFLCNVPRLIHLDSRCSARDAVVWRTASWLHCLTLESGCEAIVAGTLPSQISPIACFLLLYIVDYDACLAASKHFPACIFVGQPVSRRFVITIVVVDGHRMLAMYCVVAIVIIVKTRSSLSAGGLAPNNVGSV